MRRIYFTMILLIGIIACQEESLQTPINEAETISQVGDAKTFDVVMDERDLLDHGITSIRNGSISYYIGYQQVSSNNQNPILSRYDDGILTWSRTDYETSGDDSKGYGLVWDSQNNLYAVFSCTGTQGEESTDFRRFAKDGWLTSYGQGGGKKIAIIAKINVNSGDVEYATYLHGELSNGNSNSISVTSLDFDAENNIIVGANAWFSPRRIDRVKMECSGDSPFDYSITFTENLSTALSATASGCQ
ncbi:hypothetical protein KMW28_23850 [Flammeovirga yaeyamensis]|uniref:Lipoprotein n=1 Tax=Flammeovirga yaeyamensis TaxID=367791 RepID=A0AAX1NF12_9BACT|nr:hypothetical protein [Flammeovirga yaeyamensis]MBB3696589.1 hypothetical protein [Flammeovirga yaeyamensis]NMF33265.1 hypothetical protein [Flammeovirga yaeyamensis]QWG05456.1 hypothetical protein KMW28_23850 [Flammeovirga yaeyamensis]